MPSATPALSGSSLMRPGWASSCSFNCDSGGRPGISRRSTRSASVAGPAGSASSASGVLPKTRRSEAWAGAPPAARGGNQRARSMEGEASCASMRHGLPPCALICPLSCCCASDSCRPSRRSDCGATLSRPCNSAGSGTRATSATQGASAVALLSCALMSASSARGGAPRRSRPLAVAAAPSLASCRSKGQSAWLSASSATLPMRPFSCQRWAPLSRVAFSACPSPALSSASFGSATSWVLPLRPSR